MQNGCDILLGTSERTTADLAIYAKMNMVKVPVSGFVDNHWCDFDVPAVRQPVEKYAKTAVEALLKIRDRKFQMTGDYLFTGEIIPPISGCKS